MTFYTNFNNISWKNKIRLNQDNFLDIVVIGLSLLIMTAVNSDWIFSSDGIDGWMYFGFFKHYDVSQFLADNKKIARLPWILLGFLTHKFFPIEIATYVLRLGLMFFSATILYKIILILFNRPTAIISTFAFITYQPGIGSENWDYHNTLAGPLYLSSYLLLLWATSSQNRGFFKFFLFGILFALTVHTNILFLLLLPALIIQAIHQKQNFQSLNPSINVGILVLIFGALLGGIIITAILGIINVLYGREFLFFSKLAHRSAELLSQPFLEKSWWKNWSTFWWLKEPQTLYIESILILIPIVFFLSMKNEKIRKIIFNSSNILYLEFLISLGIFIFFQAFGHTMLQPSYMAFPLIAPTFLALSALVFWAIFPDESSAKPVFSKWSSIHTIISAMIFYVIFLPLALGKIHIFEGIAPFLPSVWITGKQTILFLSGFVLAAIISHWYRNKNKPVISTNNISIFLLISVFAIVNSEWPNKNITTHAYVLKRFFSGNCNYGENTTYSVSKIDHILFPFYKKGKLVNILYDGHEKITWAKDCSLSISKIGIAMIGMGYDDLIMPYTEMSELNRIPQKYLDKVLPGQNILAVLTNNKEFVKSIEEYLHDQDYHWTTLSYYPINSSGMNLGLFIIGMEINSSEKVPLRFSIKPIIKNAMIRHPVEGKIELNIPKIPWEYTATIIPKIPIKYHTGFLVIGLRIQSGRIGVGMLSHDEHRFIQRNILGHSKEKAYVYIKLSNNKISGPIIIESVDNLGGTIFIDSLDFIPEHCEKSLTKQGRLGKVFLRERIPAQSRESGQGVSG